MTRTTVSKDIMINGSRVNAVVTNGLVDTLRIN